MRSRLIRALPGVAVLLSALALAGAATAAEGEEGVFSWQPSLRFTTLASDNVLYEEGGKKGSLGTWIAPRLELAYRRPALEIGADLGVDLRRWIGQGSLDAELYRGIVWAEAGLGHGLSVRISDAFVPQPIRVGLPEDEGANLAQTNRAAADLRWWRELPGRRELEMGLEGSYFITDDYKEPVPTSAGVAIDRDFRADYAQGLGFVELQSPLGERSAGYARVQGSYRSFSSAMDADHGNLSLLLGVRSSRWENLELDLAAGVGALGFERFGDELRALGRASVRYRLPAAWTLSLAARHLNTPNLAGETALESTGELGISKRLAASTEVDLRVFVTRFDGDLRDDAANVFGGAELRLRHQVNRYLQLMAGYRHWRNAGGFDRDDFAQNRLLFQISLRR